MLPWLVAPRNSGIHRALPARAEQRKISAAFAWIYRLDPLEVVLLTDFNCDVEARPGSVNTVQIKFVSKNRHPVPEPSEHWLHWAEVRERLPHKDWHRAERLLRSLAAEVAAVIATGKTLVPSRLRREITL